MKVNLIGGQSESISIAVEDQQAINCYAIPFKTGVAQIGRHGTVLFSAIPGSCRGSVKSASVTYAVFGTTLYSISSAGTATSLGTISGSNRVSMATDQTNIVIVTGHGNPGYVWDGSTLSTITDADFPGADVVNHVSDYFSFSYPGGWFLSELGSATSYSALDFVGLSGETDIITQVVDHGEVINFHADRIKVWINTGNSDFPFELNGAAIIERGIGAAASVAVDDNTVFFLGDDLIVYRMQGYTPQRVSDEGLEFALMKYINQGYGSNISAAWAFTFTDHGHKFYVLTIPGIATHVINIATGLQHKLKHWDYETFHAASYERCYDKHLIFGIGGNVYEMKHGVYNDAGKILEIKRRASVVSLDDELLHFKSLKLIFDTGHGLATGQGSNPLIMLRWYDDDGRAPRVERHLSIGVMGDYRKSVKTTGMGSARRRIFEIAQTDPVPFILLDAFMEVT